MSETRYVTCRLKILDHQRVEYAELRPGEEEKQPIIGELKQDWLTRTTVERLSYWIQSSVKASPSAPLCDLKDMRALGLHLYRVLFGDPKIQARFEALRERFEAEYAKDPHLRLRLELVFAQGTEDLAALPWEFLYVLPNADSDPSDGVFLAAERTEFLLTRRLASVKLNLKPPEPELRILVVTCRPRSMGTIDEEEIKGVVEKIEGLKGALGKRVKVFRIDNPNYARLKDAIGGRLRNEQGGIDEVGAPHIVHFIGHGEAGKLALMKYKDEDQDFDLVSNEEEQVRLTDAEYIRALFKERPTRLVFLHACLGAASDSLETFKSVAREILRERIPAVVAMQYQISNADAGAFAQKFYEEIGRGADVDEAVKIGRIALGNTYPPWGHPRFGTPVVYLHTSDPIVSAEEADVTTTAERAVIRPDAIAAPKVAAPEEVVATPAAPRDRRSESGFDSQR